MRRSTFERIIQNDKEKYSLIRCRQEIIMSEYATHKPGFFDWASEEYPILKVAKRMRILRRAKPDQVNINSSKAHSEAVFAAVSALRDTYIAWLTNMHPLSTLFYIYGGMGIIKDPVNQDAIMLFLRDPYSYVTFSDTDNVGVDRISGVLRSYSSVYSKIEIPFLFRNSFPLWSEEAAERFLESPTKDNFLHAIKEFIDQYRDPLRTWASWVEKVKWSEYMEYTLI